MLRSLLGGTNRVCVYGQVRGRATKPAVKRDGYTEAQQKALKDFEKLSSIYKREVRKKPQRPPFAKNIFLGVFDTDLLAFPEVLNKEELERLDGVLEPVFELDGAVRLAEAGKHLGLFGLRAPQLMGGREFNVTEMCRFGDAAGATGSHGDVGVVRGEFLGVEVLLSAGSERHHQKYLEAVTAGDILTGFCMAEKNNNDVRKYQTTATQSGEFWIINGEKAWVINGSTANLFVVFAHTEAFNPSGIKESKLSAFFVERSFGGISSKPMKLSGLNQTDICTVTFCDTKVPNENVIGFINKGEDVLNKILTNYRLSSGSACSAITKDLLNKFIKHCKMNSDGETNFMEIDLVHEKISEIAASIYAMESLTFFTAGLIDRYEDQDCNLEAAIVKAFSAENCLNSCQRCMNFIGGPAYIDSHWCNELNRNALSYVTLDEPIDTLKIIIALQGLQHAGLVLQDEVNKMRNPMFHAFEMLSKMFTNRRHVNDDPKLVMQLQNYLHPSLNIAATRLEYCIHRLKFVTEQFLARYGSEVTSKHMDLRRMADCIIDIYAMTTVLARASRSYCIGLRNSDYEIILANAFCMYATERVKENARKLFIGPYNTNDVNYNKIGMQLFREGRYFSEHPLTKNF